MRIEIKNYNDLRTILRIGRNKVFFGNDEAHISTETYKAMVPRREYDAKGKPVKRMLESTLIKEHLVVESEIAIHLTLDLVSCQFHQLKHKFYVEMPTYAEAIAHERNNLTKMYTTAKTAEAKKEIIKQIIKLNNKVVKKQTKEELYNEALGVTECVY